MEAGVVDRIEAAAGIENRDFLAADLDRLACSLRNIRAARDFDEVCHRSSPVISSSILVSTLGSVFRVDLYVVKRQIAGGYERAVIAGSQVHAHGIFALIHH